MLRRLVIEEAVLPPEERGRGKGNGLSKFRTLEGYQHAKMGKDVVSER